MRRGSFLSLLALVSSIACSGIGTAHSQDRPAPASQSESAAIEQRNRWTVGIASGTPNGTFQQFAAELATALNDGENLRILPVLTEGATGNVEDLLYLKGIDVAITHADVFEEIKKKRQLADIEKRVNYISQLYASELNLYVRPEIKTLQDLNGKTISLHVPGSGQATSGPIVFEKLGIKPNFVFVRNEVALQKMETGEIDAIFHSGGKPNPFMASIKPLPGFHLLPIPFTESLAEYYVPSSFKHEDYPDLVAPGETVEAIAIPVVLAVYNWPQGHDRYRKVKRFIEYYFDRFGALRKPPFHPKWKAINLAATVPGWNRYFLVQQVLDKLTADAKKAAASNLIPTSAELARSLGIDGDEGQLLFQEFMEWKQHTEK